MRLVRNVVLACAAAAVFPMAASAQERVQYNIATRLGGELATRPPHPEGLYNGRLWISRPMIGVNPEHPQHPLHAQHAHGWRGPGPGAYGADEHDFSSVYAKIGSVVSSFSPWETVRGSGNHSLEAARQKWLAERGYTGGVRTFVNDLYMDRYVVVTEHAAASGDTKTVEPRATIHMPIDQPRFKSRMHVQNDGPVPVVTHTSWPAGASKADSSLTRVIPSEPAPATDVDQQEETKTQIAGKDAK